MKKSIIVLLIILLVFTTSVVFATAQDESVNGFVFNILAVDTAITAENGLILTSATALTDSGASWSILIHFGKVENNIYIAKEDALVPTGTIPTITFAADDIVIAIHSSTSDVSQATEYPNVYQKLAALKVTTGMYITLNNIDLAAKTSTNGTATVSIADPRNGTPGYTDIMGDLVVNPGYKLDVTAPEFYTPGDTLNITITMKDIVPTTGIGLIHLFLYYDATKVDPVIVNDNALNAAMESFLVTAPSRDQWESMSKLEPDQSRYDISFSTTLATAHAKANGSLVMVVPFKVKDTATETIAFQVPHKMTEALDYDMNSIYGNAGLALVLPTAVINSIETSSNTSSNIVETGDKGMLAPIIISIIAIAGVTFVLALRKRRI